jgi:hypothetical protein
MYQQITKFFESFLTMVAAALLMVTRRILTDDDGHSPIDPIQAYFDDDDRRPPRVATMSRKEKDAARYQAKKEERLAQQKAYNAAHKEEIKAYNAANKEEIAAYQAAYREETRLTRIAEHRAYLEKIGCDQPILEDDEVQEECDKIVNMKRPQLGGRSILEAFDDGKDAIYYGTTKQTNIHDEAYQWLTLRGGNIRGSDARNRPVLLWNEARKGQLDKPRQHITKTEARNELGFDAITLYENPLRVNAALVEARLQEMFQDKPLGTVRLWRAVAMGHKYDEPSEKMVVKVFLTFSSIVGARIQSNDVIVQK